MKHGYICPTAYLGNYATYSNFHLILPHLFEEHPAYKEFYMDRIKQGDHVLLDNSIFELGVSFNPNKMIELAEEMGVTEMSAPEILFDSKGTRERVFDFIKLHSDLGAKTKILTVVQGRNFEELITMFFEMNEIPEISALGLPFDLDFDSTATIGVKSLTLKRVLNRWALVDLIQSTAMNNNILIKPTHLMGLSDGLELQRYTPFYYWIRSNDSSSAFVHGLNNIRYSDRGLPCEKIKQKLDFGLTGGLSKEQHECIIHNINMIQKFITH